MLTLTFFFSPARCVCLTMYTSKWLFKNGLSDEQPLCSECSVPCPPQVNSRHMPCASLHAAAPSQCLIISIIVVIIIIIILIIIIRLAIRIFRHPFAPYPTVRWKWQVRASIGTKKATVGLVLTLTVFFFPARCVCVSDNIPPNGSLNRLSDDQPWQSWGALFSNPDISIHSDPDISAMLWMSSSMPPPPPSELSSHALCVSSRSSPLAVSHHQHHRHHPHHHHHHHPHHHHHHHHHPTCNSDFSTSICPVPNGVMKVTGSSIHRYRKSDFGVCANTDRVFFPRTMCVCQTIYLQMAL